MNNIDNYIKKFMMYDQKIRFGDAIKKILKPKHYFYLIAQILAFVLLIIPRLLIITNWPLYNIIGFILSIPTLIALLIEKELIVFAYDYYYSFPRLTDIEKDAFRKYYDVIKNKTESN